MVKAAYIAGVAAALLGTAAQAGGIDITGAVYGTPSSGRLCDASQAVASMCNGKTECLVDIRNVKLCGDPDFLVVKQIGIKYRCGRSKYKTSAPEYQVSTLACQ